MSGLLELIKGKAHWIAFLLLEGASVALLLRLNPYQHSVWTDRMTEAAGVAAEARGQVEYFAYLREENRRLTQSNITLERSNQTLRSEIAELRHEPSYTEQQLKDLLLNGRHPDGQPNGHPDGQPNGQPNVQPDGQTANLRLIPAKVCGNSVRQADNLMLINQGAADGVRREQGVVSGTGIVGIVSGVSRHYATVIPILNRRSSISCRLRGTGYFGYLHWEGGNPLVATLDDVPHHAPVKVGDAVETSGFSNIFPEGIFVGRVAGIANSADGQALRLSVQLSTDLARLSEVMVVVNEDEQDILDATADVPQPNATGK